jgi:acetoacetyl-CoA synthetase
VDLPDGMVPYGTFLAGNAEELRFEGMGFREPLYVMFSSGITDKPKCIEHSGGGTLLRLLTEHQLHSDLRAVDPMFLIHHLQLDDVELAGGGAGLRNYHHPV